MKFTIQTVDNFEVVRDDLIAGGTKQRVLSTLLTSGDHFVYASPVQGYAQIALAHACRESGKHAAVFCAKRAKPHRNTLAAAAAGAEVIQVSPGYLSNVQSKAASYCEMTGATLLPFGLDCDAFRQQLVQVVSQLPAAPTEIWCAAGSGTLARCLQLAFPEAAVRAVRVGKLPNVGLARLYHAPEQFDEPAEMPPPFPSCENYDAKVWRFITEHGSPGAFFWNVAG
jgi:cysteine synthase